jgi:hypothetical protein
VSLARGMVNSSVMKAFILLVLSFIGL